MTQLKAMQIDDLVELIEDRITAIKAEAYDTGYNQGRAVGLDERQSNIENEYYAYCEGLADARERDGHIKLYYNPKTREFMPVKEADTYQPSDIDWKDGHRDYMTDFDLRNTED